MSYGLRPFGGIPYADRPPVTIIFVETGIGGAICGGTATVQASNERQVGAALAFYHTGASYEGQMQLEQSLSLGHYRSNTFANRIGFLESQAIPNIDILDASHQIGVGNLTVLGQNVLYSGPGATVGTAVQPTLGMPITVEDSLNQWVVIQQTTTDPLRGSGSAEYNDQLNNVFGASDGTVAGETTYRGVILRNNALENVTAVTINVNPLASANCIQPLYTLGAGTLWGDDFSEWPWFGWVQISSGEICYYSTRGDQYLTIPALGRGLLGTSAQVGTFADTLTAIPPVLLALEAPSSGSIQTTASETTAPTGLTWGQSVTISSLTPWQEQGLWIQRQLPDGMTAAPLFEVNLALQFTLESETYNDELVGLFRVTNSSLTRYEVSWGINQPPNLAQAANETFTSFPYTTTATFSNDTDVYLSTNARNKDNLVSENTNWTILSIGTGTTQNLPPTAPTTTLNAVGTEFEAQSFYFPTMDAVPADNFHVYVTFDGSNPLLQTPVEVAVRDLGAYDFLDYVTASQSVGTTCEMVVRTYRSSDGMESTNTNVLSVTSEATAFGTAALKGFYRYIAEVDN